MRLRERVAEDVGSASTSSKVAPGWLEASHALGNFPDGDAVNILCTGSRQ